MMDGYSVPETASVLGVPEGKVWELLARGVLSGAPEGDGMRVFLKENPAPMASHGDRFAPPPANGGGASVAAETTPFRELLTEFRNLTERYGQALLALGEARGEVAGLRSRVDLLEARLDLRLPGPGIVPPVTWERPTPPDPMAEPRIEPRPQRDAREHHGDVAPAPVVKPTKRAPAARRSRTARSAVAGFAEALARAQDPTTAEMPSVADVARQPESAEEPGVAAPDAIAPTVATEAFASETSLAAAADARPDAPDPTVSPSYSTDVIEPDWFADGDFAWLDAAEIEAQVAATRASAEPEPEPEPEPPVFKAEPIDTRAASEASSFGSEIGLDADPPLPEPGPAEARQDAGSTAVAVEPVPAPDLAPAPDLGLTDAVEDSPEFSMEAAEPFHIGIGESPSNVAPEWRRAPDLAVESNASEDPELARPETVSGSAQTMVDEMEVAASAWREPVEDEGLARLARQEGWDAAEVEAIRALVGQGAPAELVLPGADDLDEAMAALNAGRPASASPNAPQPTLRQAVFSPPAARPPAPRQPTGDPAWLRGRRGPAATAFRRLRRLFTE